MHLREPRTHETIGTLDGLGTSGEFHEWQDGDKERRDEQLGIRTERMLRVGDRLWMQNANGEIRELRGIVARRQVTEDFIDTGSFALHPQMVHYVDSETLPDGRVMYVLEVHPPGGEVYRIGIDAQNWLIDMTSYVDHDSRQVAVYSDYRVTDGMLIPYVEVDSSGDRAFDVTSRVTDVIVDEPIAASVFAPLEPEVVTNASPATVRYEEHAGLIYTQVTIEGKSHRFLIDSASQGNVFDVGLARELGLHAQGALEIRGASRTPSAGVVQTPPIEVGAVELPTHVATVLDLNAVLPTERVDGILGYPFFAAAELRFDPTQGTLTIAKPGSLAADGAQIDVDTDRELPEIQARIEGQETRVVVDTGDANELLLFKTFIDENPGSVSLTHGGAVFNRGVGGSVDAVGAIVNDLQIGPYHLYNRYTNVVMATSGAFADRNDGGNVGYGSLRNFVMTFDLPDHAFYLQRARDFDDGHDRRIAQ
jgi:hypothetical protein